MSEKLETNTEPSRLTVYQQQNSKTMSVMEKLCVGKEISIKTKDLGIGNVEMENDKLPQLPFDIILYNILSRLPVKSLVRFKCVSKLWLSSISDPKFRLNNPEIFAIMCLYDGVYQGSICSFLCLRTPLFTPVEIPFPWKGNSPKCQLLGSCNGMVLLSSGADILLWNPCTKECAKVLELSQLAHPDNMHGGVSRSWYEHGYNVISGLCYDVATDDFKAVVVLGNQFWGNKNTSAYVASLRVKDWRRIELPYDFDFLREKAVLNHTFHWLAEDEQRRRCIVYFDPRLEKFLKLELPDCVFAKEKDIIVVGFGAMDGCLCVGLWDRGIANDGSETEVLMMKEYGVKESWSSVFSVYWKGKPALDIISAGNSGEAIVSDFWKAYGYNPKDPKMKKLKLQAAPRMAPVEMVETLLSPNAYLLDH